MAMANHMAIYDPNHSHSTSLVGGFVDSSSWTGISNQTLTTAGGIGGASLSNSSSLNSSTLEQAYHAQRLSHMQRMNELAQMQGLQQLGQKGVPHMYGPEAGPVEVMGSGEVEGRYVDEGDTMVAVLEKPTFKPAEPMNENIEEYAQLAELVGVSPPDLLIERFKAFLKKNDIPVYNLKEVVAYMDAKAKKESKAGAGWEWNPLRSKDGGIGNLFGKPARMIYSRLEPASDHCNGSKVYDKVIPLHALKKVALIEKVFGGTVKMMVCDYAPKPELRPDPFLMAVIPNNKLNEGHGRFVIDLWDEPGFGLESRLK